MTKLHFLFLKKDSFDTLNIEVNFDLKKKVNTNIDDKLFYKGSGGITLMKFLQRCGWMSMRWWGIVGILFFGLIVYNTPEVLFKILEKVTAFRKDFWFWIQNGIH